MGLIERSYGRILHMTLKAVSPIKRIIVKTECKVHKFINEQALEILKNDGYLDAWKFFSEYIEDLNLGVVWADQDLKNSAHFYNPRNKRGLYGASNALKECQVYYSASLTYFNKENINKAVFLLGAACHLVQDVTVPQHVNVKLLKNHKKYESWVLKTYKNHDMFNCFKNGIYLGSIRSYIESNARVAIGAYNKNININDMEKRFFNITKIVLCQAQRSTAGFLNMFYEDCCSLKESCIK